MGVTDQMKITHEICQDLKSSNQLEAFQNSGGYSFIGLLST